MNFWDSNTARKMYIPLLKPDDNFFSKTTKQIESVQVISAKESKY
jgi:hypothetical protein